MHVVCRRLIHLKIQTHTWSGRRWWHWIVTRTKLSLFGTLRGTFNHSLARNTGAFDFSSNDFISARVCGSSQLAHSPSHSWTTSLLETCVVKASSFPTVNVYGSIWWCICDLNGVRNVPLVLDKVFQTKAKVPSRAFHWIAILRHPSVPAITLQISCLKQCHSQVSCELVPEILQISFLEMCLSRRCSCFGPSRVSNQPSHDMPRRSVSHKMNKWPNLQVQKQVIRPYKRRLKRTNTKK